MALQALFFFNKILFPAYARFDYLKIEIFLIKILSQKKSILELHRSLLPTHLR